MLQFSGNHDGNLFFSLDHSSTTSINQHGTRFARGSRTDIFQDYEQKAIIVPVIQRQ